MNGRMRLARATFGETSSFPVITISLRGGQIQIKKQMGLNMTPVAIRDDRAFDRALLNLVEGKYAEGGIAACLAVVCGKSAEVVRSRVYEARRYPPGPLPPGTGWEESDRDYVRIRQTSRARPECLEFLQRISGGERRRPDQEDARVSRQRINGKMISLAIDLPE